MNALSRKLYYNAISAVTFHDWGGLEEEIQGDGKLRSIMQSLI